MAIDDVLDYADTTVDEMNIFRVKTYTHLQRMTSLLAGAAREIYLGVLQLKDHPAATNDHAVRAKALENRMESVYREALGTLFEPTKSLQQVVNMLKPREIYRHLSNAADRVDKAANVLGDIVVKKV